MTFQATMTKSRSSEEEFWDCRDDSLSDESVDGDSIRHSSTRGGFDEASFRPETNFLRRKI
jgi:hypothetical protein